MYPSSQPRRPSAIASQGGLTSFSSASGGGDEEFNAVGSESMMGRFLNTDLSSLTLESSYEANFPPDLNEAYRGQRSNRRVGGATSSSTRDVATSSFRGGGGGVFTAASGSGGGVPCLLTGHGSSPSGFHKHPLVDNNGFSITGGMGTNSSQITGGTRSQLSVKSKKESLSHMSEINNEGGLGGCSSGNSSSFPVGSWDDTNSIFFSNPSNRQAKTISNDIVTGLDGLDIQFNFGRSSPETPSVEKYLYTNQDHPVQCRIRAKHGCATHPRSIAERERRTRISQKLKKLQELVPNMDKQTNTADMLDFAVQHIKCLQSQVQKLNNDTKKCKCGCKEE